MLGLKVVSIKIYYTKVSLYDTAELFQLSVDNGTESLLTSRMKPHEGN